MIGSPLFYRALAEGATATAESVAYIVNFLFNGDKDKNPDIPLPEIAEIMGFIWSPTLAMMDAISKIPAKLTDLDPEMYKKLVDSVSANRDQMLAAYIRFQQKTDEEGFSWPDFGGVNSEQVGEWVTGLVAGVVSVAYNASLFVIGAVPDTAKSMFTTLVGYIAELNNKGGEILGVAVDAINMKLSESIGGLIFAMNTVTLTDVAVMTTRGVLDVFTDVAGIWTMFKNGIETIGSVFQEILASPIEGLDKVAMYGANVGVFIGRYKEAFDVFLQTSRFYTAFFTEIVQIFDRMAADVVVEGVDTVKFMLMGVAASSWTTTAELLGMGTERVADAMAAGVQAIVGGADFAAGAVQVAGQAVAENMDVIVTGLQNSLNMVSSQFYRNAQWDIVNALARLADVTQMFADAVAAAAAFVVSPLGMGMLAMAAAGPVAWQIWKWYKKHTAQPHLHRDFRMHWKVVFFMQGANPDEWECASERLRDKLEPHLIEYFNRGQGPYIGEFKIRDKAHRVLIVSTLGETDSDKTFPLILLINPKSMQLAFPCILELPETHMRAAGQILVTQEQANEVSSKELLDQIGFVTRDDVEDEGPPEFVNRTYNWFVKYWQAEEVRNKFVSMYLKSTETLGYFMQDDEPNKWNCGKKLRPTLYNFVRTYMSAEDKITKTNFVSQYAQDITVDGLDVTLIPNYTEYRRDLFVLIQDDVSDRARAVFFCPMVLPTHGGADLLQNPESKAKHAELLKLLAYPLAFKDMRGADIIDKYSTLQRSV